MKNTLIKELFKGKDIIKYIDTLNSNELLFNIINQCIIRLGDNNIIHIKDWSIARVKENISISSTDTRIQISILESIYYVTINTYQFQFEIHKYGDNNYINLNKILLEL